MIDPYTYPDSETLRNRLGIRDDETLTEAERRLTLVRGAEAVRLAFPSTTEGYRALHKHLFQDVYDWAGEDRTVNITKGGSSFAAAPYVARELDKRFAEITAQSGFQGFPRDKFFDRLGDHINEINAIHPFREGNGRTVRHHAAQLAREAGHPIRIAAIDKGNWMEASRHGFLTGDHRATALVLSEAVIERDLAPEARTGPTGIAMLPKRAPPEEQRYRVTLIKARTELERYLPGARQQAVDRLRVLLKEGASLDAVKDARIELAYLWHAKGPVYQSHLLTYLGVRQVDAVISPQQTPLERVREIGAALGVQINGYQPAQLQRAVTALERPILLPGHSPDQERLAELFLKNTSEKNLADPRLAAAQMLVNAAIKTARGRGESARMAAAIGESARHLVANRIKEGGPLDGDLSTSPHSPVLGSSERDRVR